MNVLKFFVIAMIMLSIAHADVLSPDYHFVDHKLYIDNIGEYGEYQFFIYPTHMAPSSIETGMELLGSSEIPSFYYEATPHLYAVKKTDMENRTPDEYFPLALKSQDSLRLTNALPNTDPRIGIKTHYNVSIVDEELVLTEVNVEEELGDVVEQDEIKEDEEEDQVGDIIVVNGDGEECPPERGLDYYLLVVGLGVGLVIGCLTGKKL